MGLGADLGVDSMEQMHLFKKKLTEVRASPPWMKPAMVEASQWNPYSFEGGYVLVVILNWGQVRPSVER